MAGKNYGSLVLVVMGSLTSLVFAQTVEDEQELALAYGDKVTVSIATGTKQLLRRAPSTATVITADDIASMGAVTVDEVLESVPGLHVSRSTAYMAANYQIRGIASDYNPEVLMLVNGIPMTSNFVGSRNDMAVALPVENISRIEVIRGPGSAMYGADAFAGTINIITKTGGEINGTSFGARAGSFRSWDTWFQHGSKQGDLEIAGYLKFGGTDGHGRTVRADAQTAWDTVFGTNASRAPGPTNLGHDDIDGQLDVGYDKFRFRAAYTLRDKIGSGTGIASALDPTGRMRSERVTGDVGWSDPNFTRNLSLNLQASFMHLANEVTSPLVLYPAGAFGGAFSDGVLGAPNKWERQMRLAAGIVYSGIADHRLRFGIGHDDLNLYKTSEYKNFTLMGGLAPLPMGPATGDNLYLTPHRRRLNYLYAQDEWSFARNWTLTAGLRHDRYSDFGNTTNPRLALVWEARHDLTAKLMYGTAFRAPSFVEQYNGANPVAVGNASIMPEKITTLEGGLIWQARHNLRTSLTLFHHKITDIIGTNGTTRYLNAGEQIGNGGEIEVNWDPLPSLRLMGHYAYQKNTDQTTHHDAGYAPHHHLYTRADWHFSPGWLVSTQVNRVAGRKRPYGDNRAPVPDYTSVDVTLRTDQQKNGWGVSGTIHNLFDADIREPSKAGAGILYDLPMPGRSFWIQASHTL